MSIASEITRLQGVKSDILTAIADKGVTVPVGSALADCAGLIGDISGSGGYDYSETEQVVGKWIDGRDVYRIVGHCGVNGSANSWYTVSSTPSGIDFIVNATSFSSQDGANNIFTFFPQARIYNGNIQFWYAYAAAKYDDIFFIDYVKTVV